MRTMRNGNFLLPLIALAALTGGCAQTPLRREAMLRHDAIVWIPGTAPVAKKEGDVVPVDADGVFLQAPGRMTTLVVATNGGPMEIEAKPIEDSKVAWTAAPAPAKACPIVAAAPAKECPKVAALPVRECPKVAAAPAKEASRMAEALRKDATDEATEAPAMPPPRETASIANGNAIIGDILAEVNEVQTMLRFGRGDEALLRTEKLIQRHPEMTYLNLLKASVLTTLRRRDEARRVLDTVLKDFPNDAAARQLHRKLLSRKE